MGTLEIVIGAVLLLISLVTIIICMMQEQKPQNATAALTGASNDSFYDKNRVDYKITTTRPVIRLVNRMTGIFLPIHEKVETEYRSGSAKIQHADL